MNEIYRSIGTSKQAFHQLMSRWSKRKEYEQNLLHIVSHIRMDHPGMSVKKMFRRMRPSEVGMRRFCSIARENGLMLEKKRNYRRTTNSNGVVKFANLIKDRELTGINQIWVSDITYIELSDKFYYLTIIMDAYSRRILGHQLSRRLYTSQTTIPAIKKAIRMRKLKKSNANLIFHSDGGGQYYSRDFQQLTASYGIIHSMADNVYENAKAERVIGTIKNEYLKYSTITHYRQLGHEINKGVRKYNTSRPHQALSYLSPEEFEISTNPHKPTKEKRNKKENINDYYNMLNSKTVNVF